MPHSDRSSHGDDRTDTRRDGGPRRAAGRCRAHLRRRPGRSVPQGFAEVFVDEEGGTIAWPGEADLAPDTLYIRVKTGEWPAGLNRP
ncbi:MAG: DUF2442 domain-containing protein [Actinobacteria bacterium]|nr:DUF2442 domain-containing protein [Actinomycetota bacterium]